VTFICVLCTLRTQISQTICDSVSTDVEDAARHGLERTDGALRAAAASAGAHARAKSNPTAASLAASLAIPATAASDATDFHAVRMPHAALTDSPMSKNKKDMLQKRQKQKQKQEQGAEDARGVAARNQTATIGEQPTGCCVVM
jgi:hypothetical protein